jgi:HPt (histidine-containing phosphotransfer) domain-containing protein
MAQDARTCLDAGADDYLRKPASLADIGRVLRTWLPSDDKPAESTSLLDRSAVDTLVDDIGDPGLVVTLLNTYLTELPVRVERILVAGEESSEVSGVEEAAHVLKSTSAIVGAAALSDLAAELEQSARNGSAPSEAQREQLRTLAASTETEIASIAAGLEETG